MAKNPSPVSEIRNVSDLGRLLRKTSSSTRLLFRGQNVDRPLLPKIARLAQQRSIHNDHLVKLERRMLDRFKKESVPLLKGLQPTTNWDWLSVAQHQGLPTRLLDWTANALAGLWFAVAADPPEGTERGVLWVLEVDPENETSPSKREDVFNLDRTYIFQPFHIDQRIVAQSAWFSVHRYVEHRDKFVSLEKNKNFKSSLSRHTISVERFDVLRHELRIMGVTQATMFPDLSGLCAEIQSECLGAPRPLQTI